MNVVIVREYISHISSLSKVGRITYVMYRRDLTLMLRYDRRTGVSPRGVVPHWGQDDHIMSASCTSRTESFPSRTSLIARAYWERI